MPPFCYYRILAKERDYGEGVMAYTGLQERATRSELTTDSHLSPTRVTSWTTEQRLYFAPFSILPRLTDTAREAMRDDEYSRDEAYTIFPGTSRKTDPTAFFRAVLSLPFLSLRLLCPNHLNQPAAPFPSPPSRPQKHFQIKTLKLVCSLSA